MTSWFAPWLIVRSDFADAITATLSLDFTKAARYGRQRKRRARDHANLDAILHAIIANLARAVVAGAGPIVTPLAKPRARRQVHIARPGFHLLPQVLAHLERAGLLNIRKSRRRGIASTIEPSAAFAKRARLAGLTAADFDQIDGEETVFITKSTILHEQGGKRNISRRKPHETAEVRRYRDETRRVIAGIARACLEPDGPRTLRRYFHDDKLETGGRLYGGWWQTWPKSERRNIKINGEPVACVDFQSMFPRLAYVHVGKQPPDGDLYAGIPGDREGVKIVFNAMLFRDTPLTRFPRGTHKHFPKDATAASVRAAILAKHASLRSIFERGIGLRLMKLESDILVTACLEMIDQGVVTLPIHDAVLVPQSKARRAARVMERTAQKLTGFRLPVGIERYAARNVRL